MKSFTATIVLTAGVAALTPNSQSQSLTPRQDFCGIDQYGSSWSCEGAGTECCIGSWQGICIPTGYTCCTTGLYCEPDEECRLDVAAQVQYCMPTGTSGSQATHTAEAGDDSSSRSRKLGGDDDDDSDDDDDDDDDDDNAGVSLAASKMLLALVPLFGAAVAWL